MRCCKKSLRVNTHEGKENISAVFKKKVKVTECKETPALSLCPKPLYSEQTVLLSSTRLYHKRVQGVSVAFTLRAFTHQHVKSVRMFHESKHFSDSSIFNAIIHIDRIPSPDEFWVIFL